MLLGKKSDVLAGSLSRKIQREGTLPEAFLVSGNYQIRRKRIFVSYDSMETNFRFLLGNEFLFPWKRLFVSSQETNFCFQETKIRFRGTVLLGPVPL